MKKSKPVEEGKDICYGCGKVQEYGTMKEVNQVDFDILCDKCWEKRKHRKDIMKFGDIKMLTPSGSYEVNTPLDHLPNAIDRYIEEYGLQLCPDFQRGHVWTRKQQIDYVEFFLRGGMSGRVVYFNHPNWMSFREPKPGEYNDMVCVDGLQRITALLLFARGGLPAFGHYVNPATNEHPQECPHLPPVEVGPGPFFEDWVRMARAGDNFRININNLKTRDMVLRWYIELNSGGTPHTEAELAKVKKLLKETK